MKKFIFILCIFCFTQVVKAQWGPNITIINNTACDIDYQLFTADPANWCPSTLTTVMLSIPAMSTVSYSIDGIAFPAPSWSGTAPAPTDWWAGVRTGYSNCGNSWISIGDACGWGSTGGVIKPCQSCLRVRANWNSATQQLTFN
jgi:hypothetical protein